MRFVLALVVLLSAHTASAGPYGWFFTSGPRKPVTPADCSHQERARPPIPAWSRLSWSVAVGSSSRHRDEAWTDAYVVVPQLAYAPWLIERACWLGSGGLLRDQAWRRIAIAVSVDAALRTRGEERIDVRPALRLSRLTYTRNVLSVGSAWTPSWELFASAGPTFDPRWSGGAASVGGRMSIFTFEVRGGLRTAGRGQDVMVLIGLTDLHGLWRLGPDR